MVRKYNKYKKRNNYKNYSYYGMGKKIYSDVKWLKKKAVLLNVEVKTYDNDNTGTLPTMANSIPILLTDVAQGDTHNSRDGLSIKPVRSTMRAHFKRVDQDEIIRFSIFQLNYNDGAIPQIADLYNNTGDINGFLSQARSSGWNLLYDKRFVIDTYHPIKNLQINFEHSKLKHLKFIGTGATWADTASGAIIALVASDAATPTVLYNLQNRLRYVDN